MKLLITALAFAAMSWAADVSGTWSGGADLKEQGETHPGTVHLVLTQTGDVIKGSIGPNPEKQLPISKGTITGADIVLEAAVPDKDARLVLRLKLEGDRLSGTIRAEGPEAEDLSGMVTVSRTK